MIQQSRFTVSIPDPIQVISWYSISTSGAGVSLAYKHLVCPQTILVLVWYDMLGKHQYRLIWQTMIQWIK